MKFVRRGIVIPLDGDNAGIEFTMVANPPMGIFEDMESKSLPLIRAALASASITTNASDSDDAPIDVSTADGWKKVPLDVVTRLIELYGEKMSAPKESSTASSTSSSPGTPSISPVTT